MRWAKLCEKLEPELKDYKFLGKLLIYKTTEMNENIENDKHKQCKPLQCVVNLFNLVRLKTFINCLLSEQVKPQNNEMQQAQQPHFDIKLHRLYSTERNEIDWLHEALLFVHTLMGANSLSALTKRISEAATQTVKMDKHCEHVRYKSS